MNEFLDKILNVSNPTLDSLDTNFINQYNFWHDTSYFHLPSGKEHYRLLMYISSIYQNEILFDIGTYRCMSAAALSYKMKNRIKSYDIKQDILPFNPYLPKVEYYIGDVLLDMDLHKSSFIFLDAAHDGILENKLCNCLRSINWKGLLLLDDINDMQDFWTNIIEEKYDITNKGHWNGTGLVCF